MKFIIYTDGGARGNPGPAGIGVVLYQGIKHNEPESRDLKLIEKFGQYIGETTNNQAEYQALLAALKKAQELGATEAQCFLDSELVVRQLNRQYKVRDPEIAIIFTKVLQATSAFKKITFIHIPREKNKEADRLVNTAIDQAFHLKTESF